MKKISPVKQMIPAGKPIVLPVTAKKRPVIPETSALFVFHCPTECRQSWHQDLGKYGLLACAGLNSVDVVDGGRTAFISCVCIEHFGVV